MHDILKAYPTIRSTDVESLRVRAAFWSVVEKDLLEYVHNGILTNDQATKIRERFALYIKPFVAAVMPKIKPVSRASKVDLEKRFPVLGSAIK